MSNTKENNKPVAQTVVEEPTDNTPKATGTKGNVKSAAGKDRVNVRNIETGYIHTDLPVATFEAWMKKDANKFELI